MSTMRQTMEILAIKEKWNRNHIYFSNYSNFEKRNIFSGNFLTEWYQIK